MQSSRSSTTESLPPSPLEPRHPITESQLRVWKKGPLSSYQKADPEVVEASKTIAIWELAKQKFLDSQEINVRKALAHISRVKETSLDRDLLFHIVQTPPGLVLFQYERDGDSSTVDFNHMSDIFLSYLLSQALESAPDGSESETCLRFFTLVTLMHEIVHWVLRKQRIASTKSFGKWYGRYIRDYDARRESGYAFEGFVFSGVTRYMGRLSPDSGVLVSQGNDELTFDKVTNLALMLGNPNDKHRQRITHDAMTKRLTGLLTPFIKDEDLKELFYVREEGHWLITAPLAEEDEGGAGMSEGVLKLRRSKRRKVRVVT